MTNEELTQEQTSETPVEDASVDIVEEESAVEETPEVEPTSNGTPDKNKNYLDSELFSDIRTITRKEIEEAEINEDITDELKGKYENSLAEISENQVIKGRVIGMNDHVILIDIGFKSEGMIDRAEFIDESLPKIGDQIDIYLERLEDRRGNMVLSKEKADFMRRWQDLREIFENQTTFSCKIIRRIKGGMVVDLEGIQGFLPGSQIDVRPIKDFDTLLDTEIEVRIVKLNEARKNIVVSHKVILEESLKEQRDALLSEMEIGTVLEGRVKNITDFGVFIDLGGVDGLLHITDLSWGRVNHPSDVIGVDDALTVKIIDFDQEKQRVSLGLKQLTPHPWEDVEINYPVHSTVKGKIVSMTNYGSFVELEPGVEGLIHVSEMSWTRHIRNPNELYKLGDTVDAMVLSIDSDDRKISLGVKQLQPDPWDEIEEKYVIGSTQKGVINNLTQFGAFVELESGIDGLIHVSDISWTNVIRHPKEILEKGQEVEIKILEISRDNRRISLGLKQMIDDPWPSIVKFYETGKEVSGDIIRILDKGIILKLDMDVEGIIPFGKKPKKQHKEVTSKLNPGDTVSGNVLEVKPDDKKIILFSKKYSEGGEKETKDSVKDFLDDQDVPASEKINIPEELQKEISEEKTDAEE
ncbi:MAG TPA: 30S ribosomal protein S1 [Candidatus Marinimicrobia bacterium]|jgi:small subunit ribosomal protein S1|nr:30S ribosomal protein S1 [Candidatus Neomarinimicrobiota bacterium]MDP6229448.1 30S ribosomal protein S1 [Candidatus Neomarinimicrobiota bacterium]MDP7095331.1 30S ribosomal protein S1 [Candidatus Neomarinimicrobiota bacterium]HBR87448.1 30S ribosomal protein S1 [Candidatus Neomarinimicrobiota bacterium]HJL63015.1 30S ribosomal protein S1 [Candidatus Neomarinimicrobiota bacterium]|tara:strand:+ start:882 stop:2798 length:1917 start_codon:yes stop_codon:yes gene_type:complete